MRTILTNIATALLAVLAVLALTAMSIAPAATANPTSAPATVTAQSPAFLTAGTSAGGNTN